jgi:hypothetical protein
MNCNIRNMNSIILSPFHLLFGELPRTVLRISCELERKYKL